MKTESPLGVEMMAEKTSGLGLLKSVITDGDLDGLYDSFISHEDFREDGDTTPEAEDFVRINPTTIDIVDLTFYVAPLDDPRKAFNEDDEEVQMQPHVTFVLTTRPSQDIRVQLPGEDFEVSLQPPFLLAF